MRFFKKIEKAFRDFMNEVLYGAKDGKNRYHDYQGPR